MRAKPGFSAGATSRLSPAPSSHGAGHNFLLVGNGGYPTIYAAMSAAGSGDTIMIAPGTFNIGDGAPPGQGTFGSVGSGHIPTM